MSLEVSVFLIINSCLKLNLVRQQTNCETRTIKIPFGVVIEYNFSGYVQTKTGPKLEQRKSVVHREALLTPDNLRKRGMPLCSRCYLGGQDAKTINIYFHTAGLLVNCGICPSILEALDGQCQVDLLMCRQAGTKKEL